MSNIFDDIIVSDAETEDIRDVLQNISFQEDERAFSIMQAVSPKRNLSSSAMNSTPMKLSELGHQPAVRFETTPKGFSRSRDLGYYTPQSHLRSSEALSESVHRMYGLWSESKARESRLELLQSRYTDTPSRRTKVRLSDVFRAEKEREEAQKSEFSFYQQATEHLKDWGRSSRSSLPEPRNYERLQESIRVRIETDKEKLLRSKLEAIRVPLQHSCQIMGTPGKSQHARGSIRCDACNSIDDRTRTKPADYLVKWVRRKTGVDLAV